MGVGSAPGNTETAAGLVSCATSQIKTTDMARAVKRAASTSGTPDLRLRPAGAFTCRGEGGGVEGIALMMIGRTGPSVIRGPLGIWTGWTACTFADASLPRGGAAPDFR